MPLTRDNLIVFLRDEIAVDVDAIDDATLLFSSGLADSFMLMNVLAFVEKEEGKRVGVADVTLENFDSVTRILDFAKSLQKA
jgi:acyl carrier protein